MRYRAEAKRLLRMLDGRARPGRAHAEAMIHERLVQAGLADEPGRLAGERAPQEPLPLQRKIGDGDVEPHADNHNAMPTALTAASVRSVAVTDAAPTTHVGVGAECTRCGKKNEATARFCNRCGTPLGAVGSDTGKAS